MEYNKEILTQIESIEIPMDLQKLQIPYIPLGSKVALKRVRKGERVLASGILLPEVGTNSGSVGRIIAVGPQVSPYLKKGLLVDFNAFEDIETIILGESYIIIHELSINGIIADERKVEVQGKPINPETEKRAKRIETFEKGKKALTKKSSNWEDSFEEKAKDRKKNPITSKYK